jgi:hypothetical protein
MQLSKQLNLTETQVRSCSTDEIMQYNRTILRKDRAVQKYTCEVTHTAIHWQRIKSAIRH